MLILQLFIFALFFIVFGLIAVLRKKRLIGVVFFLLGAMVLLLGLTAIYLYPDKSPF
ncbi:MAG: hypothetical protein KDC05_03120 [Bacteroidales bacterium]|nr:hypothetical protein [Bacteroidales bacterium]